jgi:hypothetical protein
MMQSGEQAAQRRAAEHALGRELASEIDHTLERRCAPTGTLRARLEDEAKRRGDRLWRALKKRPSFGVVVLGGMALVAAEAVGVGELAMGIAIGYAAWQVLREGKSIGEALAEVERNVKV